MLTVQSGCFHSFCIFGFFVLNIWVWSSSRVEHKAGYVWNSYASAVSAHHLHHLVDLILQLLWLFLIYDFFAATFDDLRGKVEKEFKTLKQLLMTCWFLWAITWNTELHLNVNFILLLFLLAWKVSSWKQTQNNLLVVFTAVTLAANVETLSAVQTINTR